MFFTFLLQHGIIIQTNIIQKGRVRIVRLFLFGSYTFRNADKNSDLDVFITDDELKGYPSNEKSEQE